MEGLTGLVSRQLWPVHREYHLMDGYIRPVDAAHVKNYYPPLESPGLVAELAKVTNEAQALAFCATWGLLGVQHGPEEPGDTVEYLLKEAVRVNEALDAIDGGVRGVVLSLVGLRLDGLRIRLRSTLGTGGYLVTSDFGSAESRIIFPEPETPSSGITGVQLELEYRSLADVVYWHLAVLALGNAGLTRCLECGAFFIQTDPRQRFCPPAHDAVGSRRQSLCGLRYRAKKSRQPKGGNQQ